MIKISVNTINKIENINVIEPELHNFIRDTGNQLIKGVDRGNIELLMKLFCEYHKDSRWLYKGDFYTISHDKNLNIHKLPVSSLNSHFVIPGKSRSDLKTYLILSILLLIILNAYIPATIVSSHDSWLLIILAFLIAQIFVNFEFWVYKFRLKILHK